MKEYDKKTGDITDDGEFIGHYNTKTSVVTSESTLHHKTKESIEKLMDEHNLEVESFFVIVEEGSPDDDESASKTSVIKSHGDDLPKSYVSTKPGTRFIREITPCPPSDPSMGDKTPAVIAWCREHMPKAEFDAKYYNRVVPEDDEIFHDSQPTFPPEDDEEDEIKKPKVIA